MKVCTVNWFECVNVTDKGNRPKMLHLTWESFVQYGSFNLSDYQFAKQGIHNLFYIFFLTTNM